MRTELNKIPNLNPDRFRFENHTSRIGVYFWCAIDEKILDTGHESQWKPIGKTTGVPMIGNSNLAILFENIVGDTVWFHFFVPKLITIHDYPDETKLIDDLYNN